MHQLVQVPASHICLVSFHIYTFHIFNEVALPKSFYVGANDSAPEGLLIALRRLCLKGSVLKVIAVISVVGFFGIIVVFLAVNMIVIVRVTKLQAGFFNYNPGSHVKLASLVYVKLVLAGAGLFLSSARDGSNIDHLQVCSGGLCLDFATQVTTVFESISVKNSPTV